MIETLAEAMSALQTETAAYPDGVRIWMRVMGLSLFISVLFTPWKSGARWVLVITIATAMGLIVGKVLFPEVTRDLIGQVLHLLLWPFALYALWRSLERSAVVVSKVDVVYRFWRYWVSAVISVSLVLDARGLVGGLL